MYLLCGHRLFEVKVVFDRYIPQGADLWEKFTIESRFEGARFEQLVVLCRGYGLELLFLVLKHVQKKKFLFLILNSLEGKQEEDVWRACTNSQNFICARAPARHAPLHTQQKTCMVCFLERHQTYLFRLCFYLILPSNNYLTKYKSLPIIRTSTQTIKNLSLNN